MKVHEVFPIVVAQDTIDIHDEFKEKYFNELKTLWFNGYENETPENSGRCSLHLNKDYYPLFNSLVKCVRKYLDLLEIQHEKLDINITKAWVGYHNEDIPQLKPHIHNGADISFCYYIQSDESSDKFCVHNTNNLNELSKGMFETGDRFNLLKKFNRYNCEHYTITPHEGTVVLFPSSLMHSTLKRDNLSDRYVIAGDIKLCLKEEYNLHHQSMPNPKLWISF
jgi:uncharacterized protein (TIGR02466 family)